MWADDCTHTSESVIQGSRPINTNSETQASMMFMSIHNVHKHSLSCRAAGGLPAVPGRSQMRRPRHLLPIPLALRSLKQTSCSTVESATPRASSAQLLGALFPAFGLEILAASLPVAFVRSAESCWSPELWTSRLPNSFPIICNAIYPISHTQLLASDVVCVLSYNVYAPSASFQDNLLVVPEDWQGRGLQAPEGCKRKKL